MRSLLSALLLLSLVGPASAAPAPTSHVTDAGNLLAQDAGTALASEWASRLTAAEAVTRPGADLDKAEAALNDLQSWYQSNQASLAKVSDYKDLMPRQIKLQIKLARVTAVHALVEAEAAVKQQSPLMATSATQKLAQADAIVSSIAAIIGDDHQAVTELRTQIDGVRAKVTAKVAEVRSGGSSSGARLHPFTVQTFDTWGKNMAEDEGHLRSSAPLETKVRELDGGRRWFESNLAELRKHPDFEQKAPQMRALLYALADLKGKRAVEMAEKGLREMNPNYFSDTSGVAQQLSEAEAVITQCERDLGPDNAGAAAARAQVQASRAAVDKIALTYAKKSAAAFRIPAEAYFGADKERLRQMIVARWKALHPADQILLVRFVKSAWERRRETTYNNGSFYHYDNSSLLAYVVIKKSAELGTAYPVYVNRNNQTGALTVGADTKGSTYSHQDVLLKNVR